MYRKYIADRLCSLILDKFKTLYICLYLISWMYHSIIHDELFDWESIFFVFREFAKLFDKKSLCKHFHNFHRYGLPLDIWRVQNRELHTSLKCLFIQYYQPIKRKYPKWYYSTFRKLIDASIHGEGISNSFFIIY